QLIEKNGHAEYKPYIQKINAQTEKLTKLIEDLLELSRVQTGRLHMENKIFSFDEFVKDVVETVQLTTSHTIILKGQTKKKVKGDRERLGQVLTNFLSNAAKYSPKADRIVISSKVNGKSLIVGVQDFGIGVAKEHHE